MKSKLIAGIFSLFLIVLTIVGSIWISEKLKELETSQSGLISADEVISSETSVYSPYAEYNSNTACPYQDTYYDTFNGAYWLIDSTRYDSIVTYDVIDNWNLITSDTGGSTVYLYLVWNLTANDLLTDEINYISLEINCSSSYSIHQLQWMGQSSDYALSSGKWDITRETWLDDWKAETNTGTTYYRENLSTVDIQDGIDGQSSYDVDNVFLMLQFTSGYTAGTNVYINWQFHPNYYETTIYENCTIAKPYIQEITTYKVHKVMMVLGGVLIIITALIVSPLPIGEHFDKFYPINNHQSDYTRKRTKRRRSR